MEVSKAFTRSDNATQLDKLCLCHRCNKVFKVKLTSWHTTTVVEPNWYLTTCVFMILNTRPHRMILNIFVLMSIRVTPLHFLGSHKSPFFGTGTIWTSCHSSNSVFSSQYLLNKSRMWVRLSLLRALKSFVGTLFSPCTLLFVNFITDDYSSSHDMG